MTLTASIEARLSPAFALAVDLSAPPGITMLFGASGSGKTTLLRCLAGLQRPHAGRIAIGDRTLFDPRQRVDLPTRERRLGYVFQHLALFPHMTVSENLGYGLAGIDATERGNRIGAIAESFQIAHLLGRRPGEMSGGEKQRASLARSLVTDPDYLLLDEPLSALDFVTQSRIIEDVRAWNAARGIPIVYVTHSHREVFALGERVVVLEAGRVVSEGRPQDVLDMPLHEPLAHLAGFENFFDASVLSVRPEQGTMRCRLEQGGPVLEVPAARVTTGAAVRIAVRAGDILLATEEPRGLSARNVLAGSIGSIQREGATVVVMVEAGCRFQAHLTAGALESLQLAAGQRIWVVIKTYSCRIVSPALT